jgi:hypothetical protein
MPTPSSPPPDRYADEIAACERELDTLYPDWRRPQEVRRRRGGFSHLSPDDAEKVKRALKIRQMRLAGRSGDVVTVWVQRDGAPIPYVHPAPAGTRIVNTTALLNAAAADPALMATLRAAGVLT